MFSRAICSVAVFLVSLRCSSLASSSTGIKVVLNSSGLATRLLASSFAMSTPLIVIIFVSLAFFCSGSLSFSVSKPTAIVFSMLPTVTFHATIFSTLARATVLLPSSPIHLILAVSIPVYSVITFKIRPLARPTNLLSSCHLAPKVISN